MIGNAWILRRAAPYLYDLDDVPARPVALVLGARVFDDGRLCDSLAARIDTTAALYDRGLVQRVVASGAADEVGPMADALRARGVRDVEEDPLGFRTFESARRARVLDLRSVVVVTNGFHLARAVYLCRAFGLNAVGARAPHPLLAKDAAREAVARERAFVDRLALLFRRRR